jgi:hypothetical protein
LGTTALELRDSGPKKLVLSIADNSDPGSSIDVDLTE